MDRLSACCPLTPTWVAYRYEQADITLPKPPGFPLDSASHPLAPPQTPQYRLNPARRYEQADVAALDLPSITALAERTITNVGGWCNWVGGWGGSGGPEGRASCPFLPRLDFSAGQQQALPICRVSSLSPLNTPIAAAFVPPPTHTPLTLQDLEYLLEKVIDTSVADYAVVTGVQVGAGRGGLIIG